MQKFSKILIANRGEIAVRVMRTAREMGYQTVAVYSDADVGSLHANSADQSFALGGLSASESYLAIDKIIRACKASGADAVHPGYGFLSESAAFANACEENNIVFIGPPASAIELMGSKRLSKIAMLENKVPCIPGYQGAAQDDITLLEQAKELGMPLMIKASAGGGGRGMRLVQKPQDLERELRTARNEAMSAFGSDEVILERAVLEPRHIEIQVFADAHGNVIHLGERDCSIQRRHQKVLEESPSPFMDAELRSAMGKAAINAARACNYIGAGTVEFLVDQDRHFYFLEMNTRLQVEHPVTELVTGQDLVQWQLLVANGETLPLTQEQLEISGHAVEVRLYAEDPRAGFLPQTGKILAWQPSPIVRTDSGIQAGQVVSPYYDPMLAKVIAWADTRAQAVAKLRNALRDTTLVGVNNNLRFLADMLAKPSFVEGRATTAFLQQEFPAQFFHDELFHDSLFDARPPSELTLAVAAVLLYRKTQLSEDYSPQTWSGASPLTSRISIEFKQTVHLIGVSATMGAYEVSLGESTLLLNAEFEQAPGRFEFTHHGQQHRVGFALGLQQIYLQDDTGHYEFTDVTYKPAASKLAQGDTTVRAAMDGAIVEINVRVGDQVQAGQVVAVLEAMKMAHPLKAQVDGFIEEVSVKVAQQVKARQGVVSIGGAE